MNILIQVPGRGRKKRAVERHGLIGELVEPYPKPIRKSKREAFPQGMAPLSCFSTDYLTKGKILFSISSADGKASFNSFGKKLVI